MYIVLIAGIFNRIRLMRRLNVECRTCHVMYELYINIHILPTLGNQLEGVLFVLPLMYYSFSCTSNDVCRTWQKRNMSKLAPFLPTVASWQCPPRARLLLVMV